MKSRKAFLLRLDPQVYDELEAWAGADLRSVNAQIEFLLKEAIRRRGKALPKEQEEAGEQKKRD